MENRSWGVFENEPFEFILMKKYEEDREREGKKMYRNQRFSLCYVGYVYLTLGSLGRNEKRENLI